MSVSTFLPYAALLASSLIPSVAASPLGGSAEKATVSKHITVTQVPVTTVKVYGPELLNQVKRKYGVPVKSKATKAKSKFGKSKAANAAGPGDGAVNSIPTTGDTEYVAQILVGGQPVRLDFDTGSSDLWVYSTSLPSAQQSGHQIYDPTQSSTAQVLQGATWNISYGDGSGASGIVYTDVVNVGGVVVQSQAIELATQVSDQFAQDFSNDGLLGLGFDVGNTVQPTQQKTFFSNAIANLTDKLFTADLRHQAPGSYTFGFINQTQYTGDIQYFPADGTQGYWGITSNSYAVGTNANPTQKSITTIVDTGTTLLMMPEDVVKQYYAQIQGAQNSNELGGWTFPCSATIPDFFMNFGSGSSSYSAQIPAVLMNLGPATPSDSTTCFGSIQPMIAAAGLQSIAGDIFLKSTFVVFENDPSQPTPRLGFAAKPASALPSSANTPSGSGGVSIASGEPGPATVAGGSAASSTPAGSAPSAVPTVSDAPSAPSAVPSGSDSPSGGLTTVTETSMSLLTVTSYSTSVTTLPGGSSPSDVPSTDSLGSSPSMTNGGSAPSNIPGSGSAPSNVPSSPSDIPSSGSPNGGSGGGCDSAGDLDGLGGGDEGVTAWVPVWIPIFDDSQPGNDDAKNPATKAKLKNLLHLGKPRTAGRGKINIAKMREASLHYMNDAAMARMSKISLKRLGQVGTAAQLSPGRSASKMKASSSSSKKGLAQRVKSNMASRKSRMAASGGSNPHGYIQPGGRAQNQRRSEDWLDWYDLH